MPLSEIGNEAMKEKSMKYNTIFLAHYVARKPIILHGSSGSGKSSCVKALEGLIPTKEQIKKQPELNEVKKSGGFKVFEKRLCFLDSLSVILPIKNDKDKVIDLYIAKWIKDLSPENCTEPTVLFLDEFNRPANQTSFHIMTELLLDRRIDGHKISDNVLIVAAANLASEDVGVVEVPNATLQRLTNIFHVPSDAEQRLHHKYDLNRKILQRVPALHSKYGVPEVHLENCGRQRDVAAQLVETGLLNREEIGLCARGLLGMEFGTMWAEACFQELDSVERKLPVTLTEESFTQLKKLEEGGMIIEVSNFLADFKEKSPKLVALYLIEHALPETCRALVSHHGFSSQTMKKIDISDRLYDLLGEGGKKCLDEGGEVNFMHFLQKQKKLAITPPKG